MAVRKRICFWAFLFCILPSTVLAGMPEVTNVMVTDVTTVSFSVIWAASEASMADVEVFQDADGMVPAASTTVTSHPVQSGNGDIQSAAQQSGVMKVMVTGLEADTTYYFNTATTSISTSETAVYPESGLMSVTTQIQTVRTFQSGSDVLPFSNDIIIEPCYLEDGETAAEGSLLIATVAGGAYPVSAFVGDGVELPYALIDLNNVFDRETGMNLDLIEGKNLTLVNFRGLNGNSVVTHEVPIDDSMAEVKEGAFALKTGSNLVSFQLEPHDTQPAQILAPIMDKLEVAWGKNELGDWVFFRPGFPFNTMTEMHATQGYLINLYEDAALKVEGTFYNSTVPLQIGANLVGFGSIESHNVNDTLENAIGNIDVIWGKNELNEWEFFRPGFPFSTLKEISPGNAYLFYTTSNCEW